MKTKWILTLSILVILLVGIAVYYSGQQDRHDRLSEDLGTAQQTLIINSQQKDLLEFQLDVANAAYADKIAVFPDSSQSMDVQEKLLGAADEAGVEITTLGCPPAVTEAQGNTSYQVFMVSLGVEGEVDALLRFVAVLGYWVPSADIESVSLSSYDDGGGIMSMNLKVYALGGTG